MVECHSLLPEKSKRSALFFVKHSIRITNKIKYFPLSDCDCINGLYSYEMVELSVQSVCVPAPLERAAKPNPVCPAEPSCSPLNWAAQLYQWELDSRCFSHLKCIILLWNSCTLTHINGNNLFMLILFNASEWGLCGKYWNSCELRNLTHYWLIWMKERLNDLV